MSRWDYDRQANVGGSGKHFTHASNIYRIQNPRHDLDVRLAQEVAERNRRIFCASDFKNTVSAGIRSFAKDLCKDLALRPERPLSDRQRAALVRCLKSDRKAVYEEAYAALSNVPDVVRYLPKKPPQRVTKEEE
jgi:hypothetical protein